MIKSNHYLPIWHVSRAISEGDGILVMLQVNVSARNYCPFIKQHSDFIYFPIYEVLENGNHDLIYF